MGEQGDAADALKPAEAASSIFKGLGQAGVDGYITAVDSIVKAKAAGSSSEDAMSFAAEMLQSFNKDRLKRGEAVMLMAMASILLDQKDLEGALSTLTQAPSLFSASGDKRGEAGAWLKLAQVH